MKPLLTPLAFAALILFPRPASALDDGLYPRDDDGIPVVMADGSEVSVGTSAIETSAVMLFSTSNANDTFHAAWRLPDAPPDPWPVIVIDGVGHRPTSGGSSQGKDGSLGLRVVDPELLEAIADGFGVEVQNRAPLGDDLERTLVAPPARLAVGEPIPIELVLTAGSPIAIEVGGRSRSMQGGARDNRFTFDVTRDGDPVSGVFSDENMGGMGSVRNLSAGEALPIEADLQDWFAEPLAPGRYTVDVHFELTLVAAGVERGWDVSGHTWDEVANGRVEFEIVAD